MKDYDMSSVMNPTKILRTSSALSRSQFVPCSLIVIASASFSTGRGIKLLEISLSIFIARCLVRPDPPRESRSLAYSLFSSEWVV